MCVFFSVPVYSVVYMYMYNFSFTRSLKKIPFTDPAVKIKETSPEHFAFCCWTRAIWQPSVILVSFNQYAMQYANKRIILAWDNTSHCSIE